MAQTQSPLIFTYFLALEEIALLTNKLIDSFRSINNNDDSTEETHEYQVRSSLRVFNQEFEEKLLDIKHQYKHISINKAKLDYVIKINQVLEKYKIPLIINPVTLKNWSFDDEFTVQVKTCLREQPDTLIEDLNLICGDNGSYYLGVALVS